MSLLFIPSGGEFVLVAIVVLLLFGSDKIPDFMRIVGKGMKEFRNASEDIKREFRNSTQDITKDFKEEKEAIEADIKGYKNKLEQDLNIKEQEEDEYGY